MQQVDDYHHLPFLLAGNRYDFIVVNTPTSRQQGLSGRDQIGADGMLFVFPQSAKHQFWMKDMRFDLDLIWIERGRAVAIEENVVKGSNEAQEEELAIYQPPQPVTLALEVPAGFVREQGLMVGDRLQLVDID